MNTKMFLSFSSNNALIDLDVYLDVNNVANLVDLHVGGKWDKTLLAEVTREHVARSAPVTLGVRHSLGRLKNCLVANTRTRITLSLGSFSDCWKSWKGQKKIMI